MKVVSVRLPDWMIEKLDELVERGIFICRGEAIRASIRLLFRQYNIGMPEDAEIEDEKISIREKIISLGRGQKITIKYPERDYTR